VLALLFGNLLLELGNMRQTAYTDPQAILQGGEQGQRYYPEPFQAQILPRGGPEPALCRLSAAERGTALVGRLVTQLLFDAQQLVVLGHPVGAAQRTGLDLTGSSTHGQVGNGVVLGLAAAVGDDGRSEEHTSELQSRENL